MVPVAKPVVLAVTSTLPRWLGDTEPRFVLDLCQALSPDCRVILLAPHAAGAAGQETMGQVEVRRFRYGPAWLEKLAYEGGMWPRLRRQPWLWLVVPLFMAALVLAIARVLRRERVDLVHAHWLLPQGFAVRLARGLARRPVPVICTAHGADVFAMRRGLLQRLQRWSAAGCGRIAAVSTALGDELVQRGVDRARIRVLPMGVSAPAAAREREPGLVAFAGRLVPKKGVDVLIEAFRQLAAETPGARLCIAGGGPELEPCRRQAEAAGIAARVQFLGPVTQERIRELFATAAVAVMPSVTARDGDAEGLGLVMIEAMAAGCPVVVTDLAVVRDVIRPEENGLVFPERDSAALAARLRDVLADAALARRLGTEGRRVAEARFGWPAVARGYAAAYRDLLAGA